MAIESCGDLWSFPITRWLTTIHSTINPFGCNRWMETLVRFTWPECIAARCSALAVDGLLRIRDRVIRDERLSMTKLLTRTISINVGHHYFFCLFPSSPSELLILARSAAQTRQSSKTSLFSFRLSFHRRNTFFSFLRLNERKLKFLPCFK